ncbi:MAG: ATP-binding cassette domain-containing protein [Thermodesulfobacteriota bacterium]|jgi:phosphate transport system ATP-binding protein
MEKTIKIRTENLAFSYNGRTILRNTSIAFAENEISAIVGPSGSGKSTFLMTLNRLWETIPHCTLQGVVEMQCNGRFHDIYQKHYPVTQLRRQVGMVFQIPNPLPMSIYKNVAFPLQLKGGVTKETVRGRVMECLQKVRLWDEVHDRLDSPALDLSGGQQQRLCIARALILQPKVLLLDEPTSALDHTTAKAIEQLLLELKQSCTILLVSHYLDQVTRIADTIIELQNGSLIRAGADHD